ncbi:MAG: 50S ribosomal protein L25 [Bryobacterales bacterium]|nr:50S ribosomal protein L25 [Bryobacteraceae bacterium]MDW8129555.1 50S ribosomal protein L25 [Bryobacterales bacterium]
MRKDLTVEAEIRAERGKNEARRLRQSGRIPAVLYGASKESVALAVDPRVVTRILHSPSGHNTIFVLSVRGGEVTPAMIVDWQYHPVTDRLLHVDFQRIDPSKRIRVRVPVVTHGDPRGVKQQGGLLEIVTREIEVECLPEEIPEHFSVDVTPLWIGQNIRAGDIPMTGSMRLVSSPEAVIAHVIALRGAVTGTPEEAGQPGAAEPEVIKKGKKEEEAEGEGKKK